MKDRILVILLVPFVLPIAFVSEMFKEVGRTWFNSDIETDIII